MHPFTNLVVLLSIAITTFALPNPIQQQEEVLRQERNSALALQKPLHTAALLAGAAAATAGAEARPRDVRIRDLRSVTGEEGMWVNIEDLRRLGRWLEQEEEKDEEDGYRGMVEQKGDEIREREGWETPSGEI